MPGLRACFRGKSFVAAFGLALAGAAGSAAAQPGEGASGQAAPSRGLAGALVGQSFPPYGPRYAPGLPGPYAPLPAYPRPYVYAQPASGRGDVLSDNAHSWPVLRASNGVGVHIARGAAAEVGYDFDIAAGYRWAFHRRAFLVVEGGYSYAAGPAFDGHFAAVGAGPELYVSRFFGLGWMPKFVVGDAGQGFAIGVRNTLAVPLVMRVFTIEIGHQYLRVGGAEQHEVRAQVGVDLAAAAHLALWLLVRPRY
jgi:hypothetical protein